MTWAGCGLHIDEAMANTPMKERCAGWETGSCPERKDKNPIIGNCKYCDLMLMASTKKRLCEVIICHMRSTEGKDCAAKDREKYPKKWKMLDSKKYEDDAVEAFKFDNVEKVLSSSDVFGSSSDLHDIHQHRSSMKCVGVSETIDEDRGKESVPTVAE
eukprot:CAMPEP_0167778064 /NCGR_PEP_ID=MMETSP0111_2-20121227/4048_1 /TAXON_ID=91324 /ORGANISM="Lotharella globosa, Strain CCCM811" /LENGTH=157 /DNA_ID=CAMNT_0007668331 /DNA_START=115 /DNA_END=588 /DNA_ORIENTATION=-